MLIAPSESITLLQPSDDEDTVNSIEDTEREDEIEGMGAGVDTSKVDSDDDDKTQIIPS